MIGVGGWSEVGVDPALYSRSIVAGAKAHCERQIKAASISSERTHDPQDILVAGWEHAKKHRGSSTFCVCVFDYSTSHKAPVVVSFYIHSCYSP